jgi:hypothetical protein
LKKEKFKSLLKDVHAPLLKVYERGEEVGMVALDAEVKIGNRSRTKA